MVFSGTRNTVFPKRSPEWRFFFLKRRLIVFVWTDENGGFPKRSFHTYHTAKGKGCYSISFVISFSCGRAKTIGIRYVCTRIFFWKRRKISPLSKILDTCGHERGLTFTVLLIAIRYYLQLCPAFVARLPRTEPHTHRIRSTSFRLVVTWLTERTYSSTDCTGGVGETIKRKGGVSQACLGKSTSFILDIHNMVNWQLSKQDSHWPVSHDHIAGSYVNSSRRRDLFGSCPLTS